MDNINIDAVVGNDPAPLETLLNCLNDPATAGRAVALWDECLALRSDLLLPKVLTLIETCSDTDTRNLCIARLHTALANVDIWNALASTSKVIIRRVLLHLVKGYGVDLTTKESVSNILLDVIGHGSLVDWAAEFGEFVLDCLKSESNLVQDLYFKIFRAYRREIVDRVLLSNPNLLNRIHDELQVLLQHHSEAIKCAAVTALVNFMFVFNQEDHTDISVFRDLAHLIVSGLFKMAKFLDHADCSDVLCLLLRFDPDFFTLSRPILNHIVQDLISIGRYLTFPKKLRFEALSLIVHTTDTHMGADPTFVKRYVPQFYSLLHVFMTNHLEDTEHADQQLDYIAARDILSHFISRVGFNAFMFADFAMKGLLHSPAWTGNYTVAVTASFLAPTITKSDVKYELEVWSLVEMLTKMIRKDEHLKVLVVAYKAINELAEKLRTFWSSLFARFVKEVRPLVLEKFRKKNLPIQLKEVLTDAMVKVNASRGRVDEFGKATSYLKRIVRIAGLTVGFIVDLARKFSSELQFSSTYLCVLKLVSSVVMMHFFDQERTIQGDSLSGFFFYTREPQKSLLEFIYEANII
ncbi:importin-5-like protein isoform X3 [Tanacetum coccineum]